MSPRAVVPMAHPPTAFLPSSCLTRLRVSNFENVPSRVHRCISVCSIHESPKSAPFHTVSRRAFLSTLAAIVTGAVTRNVTSAGTENDSSNLNLDKKIPLDGPEAIEDSSDEEVQPSEKPTTILGRRSPSGIYYVEFNEGVGPKPDWGNLVNIDFVVYTISNQTELVEHVSSFKEEKEGFLIHHGNGEQILGLEQMVHDMRSGAKRRCVIPSSLAYVRSGMLPIPYTDRQRKKFLNAINQNGGTIVLDLQVNWIREDPDDRGYYTDLVLPDEEIIELLKKYRVDEVPPGAVSVTI